MSTTNTNTAFMANNYPADASYGTTRNGLVIDLPTAQAVWANINTYSQGQATDAMVKAAMPEGKDNGAMVGDLVAIVGHGAVRSAVVVKVTKGGIQAAYKTPSTPQQVYRVALAKHDQGGERDGYTVVKRQAVRFEAPSLPEAAPAAPAAKPAAKPAAAPAPTTSAIRTPKVRKGGAPVWALPCAERTYQPPTQARIVVDEVALVNARNAAGKGTDIAIDDATAELLASLAAAAQAAIDSEQPALAQRQAIKAALAEAGKAAKVAPTWVEAKRTTGHTAALIDLRASTVTPAAWGTVCVDTNDWALFDNRREAALVALMM